MEGAARYFLGSFGLDKWLKFRCKRNDCSWSLVYLYKRISVHFCISYVCGFRQFLPPLIPKSNFAKKCLRQRKLHISTWIFFCQKKIFVHNLLPYNKAMLLCILAKVSMGNFFITSTEFDENISDWWHDCTDNKNDFDFFLRLVKWPKIAVKKSQIFQKF